MSQVFLCMMAQMLPEQPDDYHVFGFGVAPERGVPASLQLFFSAIAAASLLLGVLCLWIPIDPFLRLPRCKLDFLRFPTFCMVVLTDLVQRLGSYLDVLFLLWMLVARYDNRTISAYMLLVGVGCAAAVLAFCALLYRVPGFNSVWMAAFALATFPPATLGALAAVSSAQLTSDRMGGELLVPCLLGLAVALTAVKRLAFSLLRIYSMPSRWKYLVFNGYAAPWQHLAELASPWLIGYLTRGKIPSLPFATNPVTDSYARSDVFAASNLYLLLPFAAASFALNLLTFSFLARDGIVPWFSAARPPRSARAPTRCACVEPSHSATAVNATSILRDISRRSRARATIVSAPAVGPLGDGASLTALSSGRGEVKAPEAASTSEPSRLPSPRGGRRLSQLPVLREMA